MDLCVKFPPRDLNPGPYSPCPTNTYTCGMTITPKMDGNVTCTVVELCLYCLCLSNISSLYAKKKKIYIYIYIL